MPESTQDLNPSNVNTAQESSTETPPGSPEEFLSMAHDVNRISGEQHSSSEAAIVYTNPPAEVPPASQTGPVEQVLAILGRVPDTLSQLVGENPTVIAILVLALIAVPLLVLLLSLMAVIHVIPLLAPTLRLIGIGYSVWFIYHYLLFASGREELSALWEKLSGSVKPQ